MPAKTHQGTLLALFFLAAPLLAKPLNVLVFFADDLGQRDITCYHPESFYETPHINRLTEQGARFTQGYSANPVCSPTRYALMTGRWPTRAGLTNYLYGVREETFAGAPLTRELPATDTTVAEVLRPASYQTTFVGKWHLGETPRDWPEHHGFATNIGGHRVGHPPSWFSPYKNPRLKDGPKGEFLTTRLAKETIGALKSAQSSGKSFFICHSFYQVHTPLIAPDALVAKYREKRRKLGLKDQFGDETQYFISTKQPRKVRLNQAHAIYAAMIESMDSAVGEILGTLDELGLAENTLVIFSADNGGLSTAEGSPTSNLPFRAGKGWVYEGGIRVPYIVRWPGKPAGRSIDTPVTTLDLMPTILDAAGLEAPGPLDGLSLAPVLRGETLPARDLFWHYPHYANQGGFPGGAIRSGDHKLIENYEDGSISLYDLVRDPGERQDLAKEKPELAKELRAKLHAWYRSTGARFLTARPGGPAAWQPPAP